jgi:hypothetical protein
MAKRTRKISAFIIIEGPDQERWNLDAKGNLKGFARQIRRDMKQFTESIQSSIPKINKTEFIGESDSIANNFDPFEADQEFFENPQTPFADISIDNSPPEFLDSGIFDFADLPTNDFSSLDFLEFMNS